MKQSTDIKRFFQREDVCKLLHDKHSVGWFDGGCLIAASSIGRYLGNGSLGCVFNNETPQHFCWLYGGLVFDADGPKSRLKYVADYARMESLAEPSLKTVSSRRQIKRFVYKYGFISDESLVRQITALLRK